LLVRRDSDRASSTYTKIYAAVRRIPRGRVATYGQIAKIAGIPGRARQVGYALHALPGSTAVPWQRVINAAGAISLPTVNGGLTQRLLLEREGIEFGVGDRVSLPRYQWRPRS
jgi:methylated-DNA-protein-cysteine methyltransferase-like protein